MKRKMFVMLLAGMMLMLVGCGSGIKQEEYDAALAANAALESEKAAIQGEKELLQDERDLLQKEREQIEKELNTRESEFDKVNLEYKDYMEKMKPYEKLSVAEAEAKTAKEEKKKADAERALKEQEEAEAAAAEAAKAEAEAAKAAEEAAGYETGISYDELARTPDDYEKKKVKFSGKVLQAVEGTSEINIRLAVDSNYNKVLYCGYNPSIVESRVLEDDIITIYGTSLGLYSYKSTMGGTITIPSVYVERIDQ